MSTKIKSIILDDELPGLTYLKILCEQFEELEIVKAFNNPKLFLEEANTLDFDLCILDIEMGEINGMQIANILRDKLIVFVTAYEEYAADAFDLNAVDYIRKPLQRDRLRKAIDKVVERQRGQSVHKTEKRTVHLNSDKGKVLLYFEQINYITVSDLDSRDKLVFFADGRNLVLKNISFDRLLELLPEEDFCRINKKEIIALKMIRYFTYDEIISSATNLGIPVRFTLSEAYRDDFVKKVEM